MEQEKNIHTPNPNITKCIESLTQCVADLKDDDWLAPLRDCINTMRSTITKMNAMNARYFDIAQLYKELSYATYNEARSKIRKNETTYYIASLQSYFNLHPTRGCKFLSNFDGIGKTDIKQVYLTMDKQPLDLLYTGDVGKLRELLDKFITKESPKLLPDTFEIYPTHIRINTNKNFDENQKLFDEFIAFLRNAREHSTAAAVRMLTPMDGTDELHSPLDVDFNELNVEIVSISAGRSNGITYVSEQLTDTTPIKHKKDKSKGELLVKDYLDSRKICYNREHTFLGCIYKQPLRFDFYLTEYIACIEFDGIQHFMPVNHYGGQEGFEKTQIRDKIKTDYCAKYDIPLLRIAYNNKDVIHTLDQFLLELEPRHHPVQHIVYRSTTEI